MSEERPEGQLGAHTRREAAGAAARSAEDAWNDALPGADPLLLIAGLPDGEGDDLLALAAELVAAPARARGRPLGSANRKNGDLIKYLAVRGHRDPMVTLSMIQSADFGALCHIVGAETAKHKLAVLGIMRGAAADLMSYYHSKKPQQLELDVPVNKRPFMVVGEMNVTVASLDGFMSAGIPPTIEGEKANEINGANVRQTANVPHDAAKPLKSNDDPASTA